MAGRATWAARKPSDPDLTQPAAPELQDALRQVLVGTVAARAV
jgi:hypothetical protein